MKIFNGAPGLSPKMNEMQIHAFLSSGKMNLQFGSMDRENEPNIHPVWYIYENEKFYFATEIKSKKIQNIRHNKITYFSIASEEEPFICVRGKGKSKILENQKQNLLIAKKIILKYVGNKKSRLASEILGEIKDGSEAVVEIKPMYFAALTFQV